MILKIEEANSLKNITKQTQSTIANPSVNPRGWKRASTEGIVVNGITFFSDDVKFDEKEARKLLNILNKNKLRPKEWQRKEVSYFTKDKKVFGKTLDGEDIAYQLNSDDTLTKIDNAEVKSKAGYDDDVIDLDKSRNETKFQKDEIKIGDKLYYLQSKKGKSLYKEAELKKLNKSPKEVENDLYEVKKADYDEANHYYYNVVLKGLKGDNKDKEVVWKDIQQTSIKYKQGVVEGSSVERYWRSQILTRKEEQILKGRRRDLFNMKPAIEAKLQQMQFIPSYRLIKDNRYEASFASEEQEVAIASWIDGSRVPTGSGREYYKILVNPALTYASNWEFGVKSVLYLTSVLAPLHGFSSSEISTILTTFITGDQLFSDEKLTDVLNTAVWLKQNSMNINTDSLLKGADEINDTSYEDTQKAEEEQKRLSTLDKGRLKLTQYVLNYSNADYREAVKNKRRAEQKKIEQKWIDDFNSGDGTFTKWFKPYLDHHKDSLTYSKASKLISFKNEGLLNIAGKASNEQTFITRLNEYLNDTADSTDTTDEREVLSKIYLTSYIVRQMSVKQGKDFDDLIGAGKVYEAQQYMQNILKGFEKSDADKEKLEQLFKKYLSKKGIQYSDNISFYDPKILTMAAEHKLKESAFIAEITKYLEDNAVPEEALILAHYLLEGKDVPKNKPLSSNSSVIKYAKELTDNTKEAAEGLAWFLSSNDMMEYSKLPDSIITFNNPDIQKLAKDSRGIFQEFLVSVKKYLEGKVPVVPPPAPNP